MATERHPSLYDRRTLRWFANVMLSDSQRDQCLVTLISSAWVLLDQYVRLLAKFLDHYRASVLTSIVSTEDGQYWDIESGLPSQDDHERETLDRSIDAWSKMSTPSLNWTKTFTSLASPSLDVCVSCKRHVYYNQESFGLRLGKMTLVNYDYALCSILVHLRRWTHGLISTIRRRGKASSLFRFH